MFRKIVVDIMKDFGRCFCKATEVSAAEKSAVHAENLGSCAKATPLQFLATFISYIYYIFIVYL